MVIELKARYSKDHLPKEKQLAWLLAGLADVSAPLDDKSVEMAQNRIIDNASVAMASLMRRPVAVAREMAMSRPIVGGATVFGLDNSQGFAPEWAAWANGTAVRELDFHDTFLAADYSHPGDNIPPILAVAQYVANQIPVSGVDFIRGILASYQSHVALVKAICLHKHAIDHIAHLCPSMVVGIGGMLKLDREIIYQAIQQALHVSVATRQSRKGEISSWKAYAPAHAGKLAIEAIDRAMRGEKSPSPIYEGEDSFIAQILDGMEGAYQIELPELGSPNTAILETYTKQHSAEYQAQALIDLAREIRDKISDFSQIESVVLHTSHHTHKVIGTGANDPQKMSPKSSRETLDHSIMYIFAVALEDGKWHHIDSYTPKRANRKQTVELWQKVSTVEDPKWTERYHAQDPKQKAFGAKVIITMKNGEVISGEKALADAHPDGASPFVKKDYIAKLRSLSQGIVDDVDIDSFLTAVDNILNAKKREDFLLLNPKCKSGVVSSLGTKGIL